MADPNPQLRYATDVFDANGTQTDWEVSFTGGFISATDVYAYSGVLDTETGLLTDRTSHVTAIISESEDAATVRITPAVAAGRKLYIYRSTPVAAMLVDYVNGSLISKANLNLANDQLLKIIQEMMDNLNLTTATVNDQIGTIIDLNQLIQNIYQQVLELLAAGGIVSVAPRVWAGQWTGDTEDDTEFDIPGADVQDDGFYDVYVNGIGQEPGTDYTIHLPPLGSSDDAFIRFARVPAAESVWFAVLRGYAKPYTGPTPITENDLRLKLTEAPGPVFYADKAVEYGLVRSTYAGGCNVTVNPIPLTGDAMDDGSYFSVVQEGGQVNLLPAVGVTVRCPAGCLPQTRAVQSVVSLTCINADANVWLLSGDLAKEG